MENESGAVKSKPHYVLLDGLRGVAALMVLWYHIFEGFATSPTDQKFNHGYLAVDFFFILSGFVIGYAYDDRWKSMSIGNFFRRRLIRLHPLVIFAAVLGCVSFLIQGSVQWDGTPIPFPNVLLGFVLTCLMIPAVPGTAMEIRGNGEMFPVNGPSWSLFFEYIGNIMYAIFLRRLSTKWLKVYVAASGAAYAAYALLNGSGYYNMGVGWTMAGTGFLGGFLRLSFGFSAGLLLSRNFMPLKIKRAFLLCSLMLILLLSIPYINIGNNAWLNGLYDAVCTIAVFPIIVWMGASGKTESKKSDGICRFLSDISYPLYIIHYPIMYLFYSWIWKNDFDFSQVWPVAVGIYVGCIALAYAVLKLYDEPVRRRLAK